MVRTGLSRAGILVIVLGTLFIATGSCAGTPGGIQERDFSINSTNISNITVPPDYRQPAEQVRVEVTVSSTILPGPKGEMQAGPRSIGFDLTFLLISLVVVLAAVTVLIWYVRTHEPVDEPDEDTGDDDA